MLTNGPIGGLKCVSVDRVICLCVDSCRLKTRHLYVVDRFALKIAFAVVVEYCVFALTPGGYMQVTV